MTSPLSHSFVVLFITKQVLMTEDHNGNSPVRAGISRITESQVLKVGAAELWVCLGANTALL